MLLLLLLPCFTLSDVKKGSLQQDSDRSPRLSGSDAAQLVWERRCHKRKAATEDSDRIRQHLDLTANGAVGGCVSQSGTVRMDARQSFVRPGLRVAMQ